MGEFWREKSGIELLEEFTLTYWQFFIGLMIMNFLYKFLRFVLVTILLDYHIFDFKIKGRWNIKDIDIILHDISHFYIFLPESFFQPCHHVTWLGVPRFRPPQVLALQNIPSHEDISHMISFVLHSQQKLTSQVVIRS